MAEHPRLRQTHTYAELEISAAAYDEIARKLRGAGYDHAFLQESMTAAPTIDMHGIGLVRGEETTAPERPAETSARPDRTLGDVLHATIGHADTRYQLLGECVTQAQARKQPRGATAITFLTANATPGEIMNPETARYVGVIVWVPRAVWGG